MTASPSSSTPDQTPPYGPSDRQRRRPFRFTVQASHLADPESLRPLARRAEDLGAAMLTVADHLDDQLSPVAAMMAAADATTTLRIGSLLFANDFRHPAVLAKEIATIDRLSGGRIEFGLGAGWMATDYQQSGVPLDSPRVRIERMDEALGIISALWSAEPVTHHGTHYRIDGLSCVPLPAQPGGPPIWVGGGGRRVIEVAARRADVVHLNPSLRAGVIDHRAGPSATAEATEQKLAWAKDAAPERFDELEIGVRVHLATVTDDRESIVELFAEVFGLTNDEARRTPHALCGTVDQIVEQLHVQRERFGITTIGISASALDDLAPVIERLSGA